MLVLSYDPSPWRGENYFSVTRDVPGHEMVEMTGELLTKVFEGPYQDTQKWAEEMDAYVSGQGRRVKRTYLFYTSCPKCAKVYGRNYVVPVSEVQ